MVTFRRRGGFTSRPRTRGLIALTVMPAEIVQEVPYFIGSLFLQQKERLYERQRAALCPHPPEDRFELPDGSSMCDICNASLPNQ